MGQRLVIQLKKNNEVQSSCYYHWAGFLDRALPLVEKTLNSLIELRRADLSLQQKLGPYIQMLSQMSIQIRRIDPKDKDKRIEEIVKFDPNTITKKGFKDDKLDFLLAHKSTGATQSKEYLPYFLGRSLPFNERADRSSGLISLDRKFICEFLYSAEQIVDIHIDYGGEPYANIINLFEVCPEEEWKQKVKRGDFVKIPNSLDLSHLTKDEMNTFSFFVNEVSFSIPAFEWRDQILIAAAY